MSYENSKFPSQLAQFDARLDNDGRVIRLGGDSGNIVLTWSEEELAGDSYARDAAEYAALSAAAAAVHVKAIMDDRRLSNSAKFTDGTKAIEKQLNLVREKHDWIGKHIARETQVAQAALIPPGPEKDDLAGALREMESRNFLRSAAVTDQLTFAQDPATAAIVMRNPIGFSQNVRELAKETLRNAPGTATKFAAAQARLRAFESARTTTELARDALTTMAADLKPLQGA